MAQFPRSYNRMNPYGPQQQQQQQQQEGFRSEYQGVLQGLQSIMTISYSSIQLCSFGKIFLEMTTKLLNYIKSTVSSAFDKILTLLRIKQLIQGQLKLQDIGSAAVKTSAAITVKWIRLLQALLIFVIALMGVIVFQMQRKIQQKQDLIKKNEEILKIEQEQEKSIENNNIRQQDFWSHTQNQNNQEPENPIENPINNIKIKKEPEIDYLSDLPVFKSASKPWR